METNDWTQHPEKNDTFLKVLLVILFVGTGINILLNTSSLFKALGNPSETGVSPALSVCTYLTLILILVSGILMWKRKMIGLILYYVSKVARIALVLVVMPKILYPAFEANEQVPDPDLWVNVVLGFYVVCWAIFPIMFIFTIKHFRKSTPPVV
jgi:hypothetical protein